MMNEKQAQSQKEELDSIQPPQDEQIQEPGKSADEQYQDDLMAPLPLKRRVAYALGDFGNNFSWTFVSSFLLYFWTDVLHIPSAISGTIMLFSRFWGAISDPIVGMLCDKTRTRWGSYRPWLLFGCLPLAVVNILAFTAFPIENEGGRIAYAIISFLLLVFLFTCVNIPYTGLQAATTLNTNERAKQSSARLVGSYAGMIVVSTTTLGLVGFLGGGDAARGWVLTAVIYSFVFMVPCLLLCFAGTREVYKPKEAEKPKIKDSFKILKGNIPLLILTFGLLDYGLYSYGRSAVALYYFTYNAGDASLFAIYSLFNFGGCLVGALIMPKIVVHVKNKATIGRIGYSIVACILISIGLFIDPTNAVHIPLLFGLQFICSVFQGASLSSLYSMMPDVTEYTQKKFGVRVSGFISSITMFAMTVGMGIGTAVVGWALGFAGYIPGGVQTPEALFCITAIFTFFPALFAIIDAILLSFYKLDKATYGNILGDLGLVKGNKSKRLDVGQTIEDFGMYGHEKSEVEETKRL